jgi:trimethylamine--corrinoid protein Co-methyltransferase
LVQQVAEVLAGLAYVNLIVPGHPAIFGPWPFVSDLRTGAMSGGSGEQALLTAACAQMAHFYDLPAGMPAGMTDSKYPDAQSGYEKGYTNALAGLAGVNLVYESAGMHASLLGCEDSLSLEAIRQVCTEGPGHFLGHDQTLELMQAEYIYPEIGDRSSPKEWAEQGSTIMTERAQARTREILSSHYPSHLDPALDAKIRAKFDIKLPRAAMEPGGTRW